MDNALGCQNCCRRAQCKYMNLFRKYAEGLKKLAEGKSFDIEVKCGYGEILDDEVVNKFLE